MADPGRIDDLRRRVQKDPSSIAFAQLGEELRRAGQLGEAVDVCRAGLALHPSYLSARVTLGRALVELGDLDGAVVELGVVLRSAPENLAATRALAEVHHRRGDLPEALAQYRAALALARNDPDLQQTVADLARAVEPRKPATPEEGLSQHEFLQHLPAAPVSVPALVPPAAAAPPIAAALDAPPLAVPSVEAPSLDAPTVDAPALDAPSLDVRPLDVPSVEATSLDAPTVDAPLLDAPSLDVPSLDVPPLDVLSEPVDEEQPESPADPVGPILATMPSVDPEEDAERDRASRTVVALERWLDAIHDTRADRRA
jgi:hypothetical protein